MEKISCRTNATAAEINGVQPPTSGVHPQENVKDHIIQHFVKTKLLTKKALEICRAARNSWSLKFTMSL
jgi:hypothetical protein